MRKKILVNVLFFLVAFSLMACSNRTTVTQPTPTVVHYMPIKYEITIARGVEAPDILIPSIKKKMQEYLDDKNYWNKNSKQVNMSINITHVETASGLKFFLVGSLAPPGIVAADVVLSIDNKPVEYYKINAKRTESSWQAVWADLNDRMAGQFVLEVMETIQKPYDW